ncbi:predicted protein [Aspergillus nidulans FGSC A4]|uniref:Uncharacterized protein n=1 Tax=Emericella nidulans (strain FGSC A4 / ATCC 38163 / CBS 112.46 / NRRL 194 / M139) TaxID=227321 RepID=Q5AZI8_EMENI|nr:hypothetical protein [Aspergillus nidulans FGSC A4]EAA58676.1 predicted protein [Aspergillus nidulans FGSC A4]CBF69767.1 TPA: conserved hypothetical protein [Aspergillus nidulans FGSC A4]|eukprot:XP_663896.1 predicted protein [Aspergillus nidulans FGSC A4]
MAPLGNSGFGRLQIPQVLVEVFYSGQVDSIDRNHPWAKGAVLVQRTTQKAHPPPPQMPPPPELILDQAFLLARSEQFGFTFQYSSCMSRRRSSVACNDCVSQAVKFFLVSADEDCRQRAKKAIAVADLAGQKRRELSRLLRTNITENNGTSLLDFGFGKS